MSRWFRHYAGMMRDEKLVRVAIKSKQPIERVLWIWGAILESAAEIDDNGRYDLDPAEVAYFLRAPEADVDAILVALADAGRVDGAAVVHWGDRQFTSDRSATRVAAHRERKRAENSRDNNRLPNGNGDVTLQRANSNAPETETETETETEKVGSDEPTKRASASSAFPRPDWAPSDVWGDFLQNRKAKRLRNTATAHRQFLADVDRLTDDEWPPPRLLEHATARGWGAIYDPRGNHNGLPARRADLRPTADPARGSRPNPCLDMLYAAEAEIRAGENPEPDFGARPPLRAIGSG
jgi:hypothetical protein